MSLFDEPDRGKLIKYSSSRNLVRPEPVKKEYSRRTVRKILRDGPKPHEGFYIDKDSVVIGVTYTGYSSIHYTETRIKRKQKGGSDAACEYLC